MKETFKQELSGANLTPWEIIRGKFKAELDIDGKKVNVPFSIIPPYTMALNRKKYANIIDVCLRESGLKYD